jgi:hypothetical protein
MRGYEQWHGAANSAPRWTWPEFTQWIKGKTPGVSALQQRVSGVYLRVVVHPRMRVSHAARGIPGPTLVAEGMWRTQKRGGQPVEPIMMGNRGVDADPIRVEADGRRL